MLIAVVAWIGFSAVVGAAAGGRGRSGVGWCFLALILSPLIAGILLAILPDLRTHLILEDIAGGNTRLSSVDDRALQRNLERDSGH